MGWSGEPNLKELLIAITRYKIYGYPYLVTISMSIGIVHNLKIFRSLHFTFSCCVIIGNSHKVKVRSTIGYKTPIPISHTPNSYILEFLHYYVCLSLTNVTPVNIHLPNFFTFFVKSSNSLYIVPFSDI